MALQVFDVRGMHCQNCVGRIGAALRAVPGVTDARVTLEPPRVEVETSGLVAFEAMAGAVREAGAYTLMEKSTGGAPEAAVETVGGAKPSLYPLVLIVAYIAGATGAATFFRGDASWHGFMNDFMAGFFLVFSFFKLLDVRGFAGAYRMYDLPAKVFAPWAWVYPFVELGLGVAYLIRWEPVVTNVVTLGLMLVGSAGVLVALSRKQAIRCACLGTVLNLPMTTVTLVEDLGMVAMAGAMLWLGR